MAKMNQWTYDKKIKVEVVDHYLNPRTVTWKEKRVRVADYELFTMFIKDTMERYTWSKEQALNEYFEV